MSLFKKKECERDAEALAAVAEAIRRREFCIQQAAWVCDERPGDVIRTAENIYEWVYGAAQQATGGGTK